MSVADEPPAIDIPLEQILASADFLERYARSALVELEDLLAEVRERDYAKERVAVSARRGALDDEVFIVTADAASAFREAAQWLLMVDITRGRDALLQASRLFLRLGQPYGLYLSRLANQWDSERSALTAAGLRNLSMLQAGEGIREMAMPGLLHAQQQAYLILAAAATPDLDQQQRLVLQP